MFILLIVAFYHNNKCLNRLQCERWYRCLLFKREINSLVTYRKRDTGKIWACNTAFTHGSLVNEFLTPLPLTVLISLYDYSSIVCIIFQFTLPEVFVLALSALPSNRLLFVFNLAEANPQSMSDPSYHIPSTELLTCYNNIYINVVL